MASVAGVLAGRDRWACECADALAFLRALPDDSVDLLFTSPPYEAARSYSIGFNLRGQAWVDWVVEVVTAAAPKVKGLIAVNCEGQTRGFRYSCTPFLLVADLHRAGFNLRKPVAFRRSGIPGSGGPDWLRNDWEPVVCVTRPGKLPWSDPTACGGVPKWAAGGDMSNRKPDGTRVSRASLPGNRRRTYADKRENQVDGAFARMSRGYTLPERANPGNVLRCNTGGNHMGHDLAHENEAPFPLDLAAFFVRTFCPPGGVVCDPFAGSGTTLDAAIQHGRRAVGCDVRQSQVDLTARRMATVTPTLFAD